MPILINGLNQQTAATLAIMRQAMGGRSATRRTKRRKSSSTKRRTKRAKPRKARTSRKKLARLVKGSAAARAYMKKIRRKRK